MSTETIYTAYQPMLFSLAYRMLGSVMDAEDMVQETFITFERLPNNEEIEHKKAYLCRMVTNRCIDLIRSSAKQREVYVGPWLPEPLLDLRDRADDPSVQYLQEESISTAYLLLLQQLNATERAVFLLRKVFHYSYEEIADMLGKSVPNCRQIARRAKNSIHYEPAEQPSVSVLESKVKEFVDSIMNGNIDKILELVREDVVFYSDGGGKVKAAGVPIYGAASVIQLMQSLRKMYTGKFTCTFTTVNGSPGLILTIDEQQSYVYSFAWSGNQIQNIYAVANPDKLRHLKG
ncbi:RNA polymerase sigma factor SigJ [Paenibacillus swuensis]|uniref:RNA polymerase sigma factor SigJ n=1 Tax=Paenibacillus swuensis TaxID=1178515 RepID=A0A172TFI0_9BACL|nr:RNA polymerase sigma-70 factor [Paenibacillus swuensis]ANE45696.1 RNA polymerase sigma factor SigJ [Paenibacillus swuensis]